MSEFICQDADREEVIIKVNLMNEDLWALNHEVNNLYVRINELEQLKDGLQITLSLWQPILTDIIERIKQLENK